MTSARSSATSSSGGWTTGLGKTLLRSSSLSAKQLARVGLLLLETFVAGQEHL